jgi:hypothetical protein
LTLKVASSLRIVGALLATAAVATPVTPRVQACALQAEHAAILVMQSPEAVKAKTSGGCPAADYAEKAPGFAVFQVRDLCPKSGEGMLGNYLVDLNSGQVWGDTDGKHTIDTPTLRTTRKQVCSMSMRGVIPSLLPQGHTSRAAVSRVANGNARKRRSTKPAAPRKS